MNFLRKIGRLVGNHRFPDGSTLSSLTKESLILDDHGRCLEIPFVYDGSGMYNVYIESSSMSWFDKADPTRKSPLSVADRKIVREKINEYCTRRAYSFRVIGNEHL